MTTPDGPGPLPPAGVPTNAPTPGVSPAVVKHPGMPTVPDFDPTTLALQIQRLGNAGETSQPVGRASVPASDFGGGGHGGPPHPPTTTPFSSPLSFDSILPQVLSIPLFDEPRAQPPAPQPLEQPAFQIEPTHTGLAKNVSGSFDPNRVRAEFPILKERVNGRELVWLDNAATTQKPQVVIDRLVHFYSHENSNIHRAAHTLAGRATAAYEDARETTRRFLNAPSAKDIIFVRGATEGINLIAKSWGQRHVKPGDEIVITHLEHHANIVPWQQLCSFSGATLKVAPVNDRGEILLQEYERLLGPKTRLVSIPQVSNAIGTITPAGEMVRLAHRHGAKVLVDGAQAVSHMPVDVQALECDFYVFSGHKVFAPTGIGAVFARKEIMDETPPWQGGGNMIEDVTFEETRYHPSPQRFEAGTGNIADAVGLGTALEWLSALGIHAVERYEHELLGYATEKLLGVPGLRFIGAPREKAGVLSFVLAGKRTEDVSGMLDKEGIAVRSGHHCAQPILRRLGVEATVRASLAPYNTVDDIDALCAALMRLQA